VGKNKKCLILSLDKQHYELRGVRFMSGYLKIAVVENEFEAQLLQSILDEQGIVYYLKSYYDIAYDGLFQKTKGWGSVYAPENCKEVILEIIAGIRNQSFSEASTNKG